MDPGFIIHTLTLLLGFYMAWNIGANDVANAMGTSVGSKALSLKQAVILAAVLEFSGAFFVGSNVSDTIQNGILDPTIFEHSPMIFVLGMMGSLLATGALLQIASYFGLPVSTTHAIVGAVIGFGAVAGGIDAISWIKLGWIASSWILSPLLSGIISYFLFHIIQKKILFAPSPMYASKKITPYFVFLSFTIVTLSMLFNGLHLNISTQSALVISLSIGLIAAFSTRLLFERIHEPVLSNAYISFNVEEIFVPLQILSASLVAFAHGANDVANAIGPVSAVISTLKNNTLLQNEGVPIWLLALGGGGIVIGLATWGWRVIETIGKKITELTPSRGFAAEFGAAITILFASKLGLPISTTHALIGSVFGVGLVCGTKAINKPIIKEIALSWIITIPLCALFSIIAFYLLKFCFL